jgi:hypothetical protein
LVNFAFIGYGSEVDFIIDISVHEMICNVNNTDINYLYEELEMKNNGNMAKEIYISFRTTMEIKDILQKLADEGYRSLSQQSEMAVIEWLKANGHLSEKKPKK